MKKLLILIISFTILNFVLIQNTFAQSSMGLSEKVRKAEEKKRQKAFKKSQKANKKDKSKKKDKKFSAKYRRENTPKAAQRLSRERNRTNTVRTNSRNKSKGLTKAAKNQIRFEKKRKRGLR